MNISQKTTQDLGGSALRWAITLSPFTYLLLMVAGSYGGMRAADWLVSSDGSWDAEETKRHWTLMAALIVPAIMMFGLIAFRRAMSRE